MHVHRQLRLIILLLGIQEKVNQKNCFLFCKKYGLFNSFIFLTIKKFYCPTFETFMVSVQGDKILVFHTRSKVVSAMERVRSKNLYTNSFTRNEL